MENRYAEFAKSNFIKKRIFCFPTVCNFFTVEHRLVVIDELQCLVWFLSYFVFILFIWTVRLLVFHFFQIKTFACRPWKRCWRTRTSQWMTTRTSIVWKASWTTPSCWGSPWAGSRSTPGRASWKVLGRQWPPHRNPWSVWQKLQPRWVRISSGLNAANLWSISLHCGS